MVIDQIKKLTEIEGITLAELERIIGAGQSTLSRSYRNKTDIQAKWLTIIIDNYPLYSAYWLLTGRGEPHSGTTNNQGAKISVSNLGAITGGMSVANMHRDSPSQDLKSWEIMKQQLEEQIQIKDKQIERLHELLNLAIQQVKQKE